MSENRSFIKHIAYTVYPADDVAGTRAWYEEKLGLTFAGPYEEDGIEKYNEAHLDGGCFSLMASEWVERSSGSAASIVFEVDDIDAAARSLREKGVDVGGFFDGPVCRQFAIADPEGNKITFHEKKSST